MTFIFNWVLSHKIDELIILLIASFIGWVCKKIFDHSNNGDQVKVEGVGNQVNFKSNNRE